MKILDSNIWIALFHEPDSQHQKAVELFQTIELPVWIPDFVISEVCTILSRLAGKTASDRFLDIAINNNEAYIFRFSDETYRDVIEFYRKYQRRDLSFIDVSLLYLSNFHSIETFDIQLHKAIKNSPRATK